jgi:hypothetical protein
MARRHERYAAGVLGLRLTRGSGNQPNDQTDGRDDHGGIGQTFEFAAECKSTLSRSFSVTRAIWTKLVNQAGLARPALPVRLYDDVSLTRALDLVVLQLDDFAEMRTVAQCADAARELLRGALINLGRYSDQTTRAAVRRLAEDVLAALQGEAARADRDAEATG